jgi:MFS family permease
MRLPMSDSSSNHVYATWPLLLGMGLLMLGAGLQGTLIGLRATLDGFPPLIVGIVMSCYYVGYIGGSVGTPRLVARVGHIRVFAALTAVASVTILLQAVLVTPTTWSVLRALSGFCFAGIYVVAESWLNDRASNANRGALLALYMVVIYVGLGAGQFLLNVADPAGPLLFVLISVLISLAVVPMSLSVQRAPEFSIPRKIAFKELLHASPLGVVGVFVSGVVTGSVFSMGPVYGQTIGLDTRDISVFMAVGILAAVCTQWPIGRWSDRVDRRNLLIAVCLLGVFAALGGALLATESKPLLFMSAAVFGGMALTIYSLSLSHINDHLSADQIVSASASVILLNGAGSIAGPLIVALTMQQFGSSFYFYSLAAMVTALMGYGLWRKRQTAPVPTEQKVPFVNAQPQAAAGQMLATATHDAATARDDALTTPTPLPSK